MLKPPETVSLPLKTDDDGNVRVSGTRVTLHTIIKTYQQGYSPEEIHASFPTVPLHDVYAVIGYYLSNRDVVDKHIREVDAEGERWQAFWESQYTPEQKARQQELRELATKKRQESTS